jgi:long-chain acyl-CoA synthetase
MGENFATLAQAFESRAQKYGDRTFLKDKSNRTWRDHSWAAVANAAARLRAGLQKIGIRPGDRVGILSDNSPQWVIVDQAVLGLGGIVVPLYTTSGAEETRHVISDSGATVVAANGAEHVKKLCALAPSLPELRTILAMHGDAATPQAAHDGGPAVTTMAAVSEAAPAGIVEGSREDIATLIYTSGTTGPSKGVILTHGNLLANCADSQKALTLSETDMTLSFLPVAHSFERTAGYYTVMIAGGTIAYAEGLASIASNLLEIQPTIVLTVPRLLEVIYGRVMATVKSGSPLRQRLFRAAMATGASAAEYRHRCETLPAHLAVAMALFRPLVFHKIRGIFGSRLRVLISGGAPLPKDIFRFLAAAEVPLVEGYGLTEASPVVSVNPIDGKIKIGTVGPPLEHVEARTAADGELQLRGPSIMKGYLNSDAETHEAIDSEGWLHTGDVASIDADGYITITDRKKEIIVLSGGKNISPANLETRLAADPHIAQACVIGDRRKHLAALLVPNLDNLRDYLAQNGLQERAADEVVQSPVLRQLFQAKLREFNKPLSDVEAISSFTLVANPFTEKNGELTPTLKLRRKVVQEHYRDAIEAMYRG